MTPETPAANETPAVDAAALQAQIAELREQVAEGQRTAQYWAEKASSAPGAAPPAAAAEEDDTDVLEALTMRGAKGFDELAAKRGFIRKNEVEQLIDARATALTRENDLMTQYPDLRDKTSDFFKATALHYGQLVKDGTPQLAAMGIAAGKAELDALRAGAAPSRRSAPTPAEKETARLARIAAQSGDGGNRRPSAAAEDDDELTPEQKHIAEAMGITHEAYAKRARAGVSIKGGGR